MPELPEVEHAARGLGAQIIGRRIVAVTHLDWERMVETPPVEQFRALLEGREVLAAGRRAKWILLTLDGGWTLALHLRMSGTISVHDSAATPDTHTHLVLLLDDGRQVFFHDTRKFGRARLLDMAGLFFHDTRKFGRARLLDMAGLAMLESAHGLEPLTDDFTPAALAEQLRGRRTRLKPLLLDQKVIAGIGNIYADEALWHAQLHPLRLSDSLSDDEIARLHTGIRTALLQGLEHGGSTLRDYRNSYGDSGSNQEHFKVYNQQGKPCPRCWTTIEKIVVGQRGTHLCPACQVSG
jgi:formamidopyrimidine-DNA glycosylase